MPTRPPDLRLVRPLVTTLARELLPPRFANVDRRHKADGSLVTEADELMQARLTAALREAFPGVALLGEEMDEAAQRQVLAGDGGFWCLDPVDGTTNFAHGIPLFAVSLAYIQGGAVRLGVVYDPLRDECFSAIAGGGAWLNDEPLRCPEPPPLGEALALIDFKRLPATLAGRLIAEPPFRSLRSLGSVALEWCWIAAGRGHLYLHGRQRLWDYAAGALVLAEAGGRSATLDGVPVLNLDLTGRSALAARDPLFDPWQGWLRGACGHG